MNKQLSDKAIQFNREMAAAIYATFDDAVRARKSDEAHFEGGLDKVLDDCHKARRGILPDEEKEVAGELAHVGLDWAKRKAVHGSEFIVNLVRSSIEAPLLEPTPVPQLPEDAKEGILNEIKKQLLTNQFQGDLRALTTALKTQALGTAKENAIAAAAKAETALRDQLIEANYLDSMRELIDDFSSMPYAVAKYPHYQTEDTPVWKKNKWTLERTTKARVKRVSPHAFWILNGTNPQNAQAVFELSPIRNDALKAMKGKKGWRSDEIDLVLSSDDNQRTSHVNPRIMMSQDAEESSLFRLSKSDTQELLYCYTRMSGKDLIALGVDKQDVGSIDKDTDYEVCAALYKDMVVHLTTLTLNSPSFRPYFVASYELVPGHWAGSGIIQRVLKAAKIARAFMYSAVRNAAYSATPTGEMVYDRLAEFYPEEEDLQKFNAGHMYLTSADRTGSAGGRNAVTFYNVPNETANLIAGMKTFTDLIDYFAAVPKIASGDMSGQSTLGRSYRGIAMVMKAESATVKASLLLFDERLQEAILQRMYYEMMAKNKDPLMAGDAILIPRSTSGYVDREAQAAARSETLTAAVGLAQAGLIDKSLLESLVAQVLKDQGVDVDAHKAKQELQAALQGVPADQAQGGGGQPMQAAPDGASASTGVKGTGGETIPL